MEQVYDSIKKLTYGLKEGDFQKKVSVTEIAKDIGICDSSINRQLKKARFFDIKWDMQHKKTKRGHNKIRVYWIEDE